MSESKKILLVDDDPDIIEQLSVSLAEEGYVVTTAGSQEEAEEALLAGKPDLAILDLMMEEQDSGFVLCYELKKLFPGVPVIILTSVKSATGMSFAPESSEEQSWVKADSILDKPVRPERLKNEIHRLLVQAGAKQTA
jgi:CheY-like chemotaxis protein